MRGSLIDFGWAPDPRPANDDFADALVLDGASGSIDGSTVGATLEAGESFGDLSATTWYRWTAPDDGWWDFDVGERHVLVFDGDDLPVLRLVGHHYYRSHIPVAKGGKYHIAIAEDGSRREGGDYTLRWRIDNWRNNNPGHSNDLFGHAASIQSSPSGETDVVVKSSFTVEPGEPAETGVKTGWWRWEAPKHGMYTWRLEGDASIRSTVFSGPALGDLALVAERGRGAPLEFLVDATVDTRFSIALGHGNGTFEAYQSYLLGSKLSWGPTPDNDDPAFAAVVSGATGSVSGSTRFATTRAGERTDILGRSTLWWSWDSPTDEWVRFAVDGDDGPWALAIHRDDGLGGLEMLASSRWQRSTGDAVEVLFHAEAGVRYTIALGARGDGGGDFTLRWGETEAPGWLRYVGRLADGDMDANGDPVEIRGPAHLEIHASGTPLYLASELGLQVFERAPASGRLDLVQTLESDFDLARADLIWDAPRDRLLAYSCGGAWRAFARSGASPDFEDLGELAVADDPGTCDVRLLLTDRDGRQVYRAGSRGIEHFDVQEEGSLRFVEAHEESGLLTAVLSNDGKRIYLSSWGNELGVLERDAESGRLTWTDFEDWTYPTSLAISDDDAHLFAVHWERATVYSLEDPSNPHRLATFEPWWRTNHWRRPQCPFADVRADTATIDVLCSNEIFTVRYDSVGGELIGTDLIDEFHNDRFNGPLLPYFDDPLGMVASPDDRHLYAVTSNHGILMFARTSVLLAEEPAGAPDLAIHRVWSDAASVTTGNRFGLGAVIHNLGNGQAVSPTLRFYRSDDTRVSRQDEEVGSLTLRAIAAAATRGGSVEVVAPSNPRVHYYGACVDDVTGEADPANNCSAAVPLTVTQGYPDLVVGSPSVSDASPEAGTAFTLRAAVRNSGDGGSAPTTLRYYRSDDATVSTQDAEVETAAIAALTPAAKADTSVDIAAPDDPGAYYYGACVDPVSGESDPANNCSSGIAVTVWADDHGDTFSEATSVAIPSTTAGNLTPAGDRDYFRLDVDEATTLTLETTGDTDTFGTLFDADENSLATDDDGGSGPNFRIERPVEAGTYYVEVRGNSTSSSGPYSLSVTGSADDHGDTFSQATAVAVPSTTAGNLEVEGDIDTFRLDVDEATALTLETTGDTDTFGQLFDATGTWLQSDNDNGSANNFRIERQVKAGTYYIEVLGHGGTTTGPYSLSVSATVDDVDDHGDTFSEATSVAIPSTTAGNLTPAGDRDYFRLEVDDATTLTLETTGDTDTFGTLFDADENSLDTDDDGGSGLNFRIERQVEAGTYYVEVRGYGASTGHYSLSVVNDGS